MNWSRITALTLSIISIFSAITMYGFGIAIYLAPIAIIFAIVSLVLTNEYNRDNPDKIESRAMAITALIIAIIALIIGLVFATFLSISFYKSNAYYDEEYGYNSDYICYETIYEKEEVSCGDYTVRFDSYSKSGNTYTVNYTIVNDSSSDYDLDTTYDVIGEYVDSDFYNFDEGYPNEKNVVTIPEGDEKALKSTFEVPKGYTLSEVKIVIDEKTFYLDI